MITVTTYIATVRILAYYGICNSINDNNAHYLNTFLMWFETTFLAMLLLVIKAVTSYYVGRL